MTDGKTGLEKELLLPWDSTGDYLGKLGRKIEGVHNPIIYILLIKKKKIICYLCWESWARCRAYILGKKMK